MKKLLYFCFLITFTFHLYSQDQKSERPFPNSEYIKVNNLQIHYRQWQPDSANYRGKILYVHGFCGSTFSWRHNIQPFVDSGYHVFAIDLPPFGYSDRKSRVNHAPTFQANLTWNFIDKIDTDEGKWNLIGHSLGSSVIGAMAAKHPEKTAGIVFLDGVLFSTREEGAKWRKWLLGSRKIQNYVEIAGKIHYFKFKTIQKLLTGAYAQKPDSQVVMGYLQALQVKKTASGIMDMMAFSKPVFNYTETDVKSTPFIIWGDQDSWVPLNRGKYLHSLFPDAEMHIIEGAGHCPNETHPEVFNELVFEYLDTFKKNAESERR